jgi:hypothetical protein
MGNHSKIIVIGNGNGKKTRYGSIALLEFFDSNLNLINLGYKMNTRLHPPFRFSTVSTNVYRGAYPKSRNFTFLKTLKLRTIVSLTPDSPMPELLTFCANHSIQNIHIKVTKF